jgi:hypothetical protein
MMNEENLIEQSQKQEEFDEIYNNIMQLRASVIDANIMIVEAGRAAGKTVWFAKRFINVGYDMPSELSFFGHKTYIALVTNIVPNLIAYFKTPQGHSQRPLMREGFDYVMGEKDLPHHFNKPRYPIENPNHSIVLSNGHHYRLVSSDQPDSIAGANGVHAFIEEMKHNKGDKVKTRIFPALRGGSSAARRSHYYQGVTGVSDTARVDLGEDDWFIEYEKLVRPDLIKEIITVALHVNNSMFKIEKYKRQIVTTKEAAILKELQEKIDKHNKIIRNWAPVLSRMRRAAVFYLKASSFVNKDFLGFEYFKTQLDVLEENEFLTAIGNIRPKKVTDLFFSGFKDEIHCYSDSYIYNSIYQFNLKDTFKLSAELLKYFDPNQPLILGYDPGHFSSVVVGQEDRKNNFMRIIKEFFVWIPKQQGELAALIYEFFGSALKSKRIIFYYDRAGNKTRTEHDRIVTDARLMAAELKKWGFYVEMKNEKQRTIYYYEHFKLLQMILSESIKSYPRLRIDENECSNLVSAINLSPVDRKEGKIALDKSSEKKIAFQHQAGLSTQLPSALMYMLYGHYSQLLPNEIKSSQDLISHVVK